MDIQARPSIDAYCVFDRRWLSGEFQWPSGKCCWPSPAHPFSCHSDPQSKIRVCKAQKVSKQLSSRGWFGFVKILLSPYYKSNSSPILTTLELTFHFGWCLFLPSKTFKHILFFFFQLELTSFPLSVTPLKTISSFPLFSASSWK